MSNKIHTLTFNENTYTLVPLKPNNPNYVVYKNGVDTSYLLLFQEVTKFNPTSHFNLYVPSNLSYKIPSDSDTITIELMSSVISKL